MPWVLSTTLAIFVPLILINWYVGGKILNAVVTLGNLNRSKTKLSVLLLFIAVNLFPPVALVLYSFGGRDALVILSGENHLFDALFVYPFWCALVLIVQLFLLFLLVDVAKIVLLPIYNGKKDEWKTGEARYVLFVLLFILIYSAVTIYLDTWTVRLSETAVKVPELLAALEGTRIALVSDIHGDGRMTPERIESVVEKVNALQPDLIFYAGDAVTGGEKYIVSTVKIFGGFNAPYGKIAAVGDHDIFSNKTKIVEGLRHNGFQVVEDSTITLNIKSTPIAISVFTYTYRQRPSEVAMQNATNGSSQSFNILLVHQPAESLIKLAASKGYHLFAAGHTRRSNCFRNPGRLSLCVDKN